jgi:glycopeptide antibiotics resistance protein
MFERFAKPILIITAVSMFAWILFWSIVNISKKKYRRKISYKAEIILFLFYIYVISVMTLTVIPFPFNRLEFSKGGVNLIPVMNTVSALKMALKYPKYTFAEHTFQNLIGNIIMFIPFGIFLPVLSHRYRSLIQVIVLAFICSASIETVQFIERQFEIYRFVDIDDVILNVTGAVLGFIIINNMVFKKAKMWGKGLNDW